MFLVNLLVRSNSSGKSFDVLLKSSYASLSCVLLEGCSFDDILILVEKSGIDTIFTSDAIKLIKFGYVS